MENLNFFYFRRRTFKSNTVECPSEQRRFFRFPWRCFAFFHLHRRLGRQQQIYTNRNVNIAKEKSPQGMNLAEPWKKFRLPRQRRWWGLTSNRLSTLITRIKQAKKLVQRISCFALFRSFCLPPPLSRHEIYWNRASAGLRISVEALVITGYFGEYSR